MHKEPAQTFCDVLEDPRGETTALWSDESAWITADSNAVDRLEDWE